MKTNPTKPYKFNWNPARRKAAKLAASTLLTQGEIAKECGVSRYTVNAWFQAPEFLEKINEYVLADERATKAGILKRCYISLEEKSKLAAADKTTELDYLKLIATVTGIIDKKNSVNIVNTPYPGIVNTPAVKEAVSELCRMIREADDAADNL